jgi:DNA-binding transcriptional MerR regulator
MSRTTRVGEAATLFDVTPQTIRRWADEFSTYLSSGANPPHGNIRTFTEEDMQVLALVATVKNNAGTYEDAHARLRTGERGKIPKEPLSKEQQEMAINQVMSQNRELRQIIDELEEKVDILETNLVEERRKVSHLEGIIAEKEKSSGNSGQELEEARSRIEELLMKIAVLEYQLYRGDD